MIREKYSTPHPRQPLRIWMRRRLRNWPVLLWLTLIGVALFLSQRNPDIGIVTGNVTSEAVELGAPETILLASVDVVPGQKVRAGDIVARLDTRAIDGEIAMQEALVAQALSEDDYVVRLNSQLAGEVASVEADLLVARMEMAKDSAEFVALDADLPKLNQLLVNKLIDASRVAPVRAQHAALAESVKRYPDLIKAYEEHLAAARKRYEDLKEWISPEKEFDVRQVMKERASAQLEVLKTTLNMYKSQRETYILRSPIDGMVSRISFRPGATVIRDEPIIRIAPEKSDEINVFLREEQARSLTMGMTVHAHVLGRPGETVAVVTSLAPDVNVLPTRLNRPGEDVDMIVRGRRAILKITGPTDLLPGETVRIRVPTASFLSRLPDFFQ